MTVVGVTGHQDLPRGAVQRIVTGIEDVLRPLRNELVGVSSLAAGADQLFARAVLGFGGSLHAVIPCSQYEKTFSSTDLVGFRALVEEAELVETLSHPEPTEHAFLDAGQRVVDLCEVLVAVWDGDPAQGQGGTADIVGYASRLGRDVSVVWPPNVAR